MPSQELPSQQQKNNKGLIELIKGLRWKKIGSSARVTIVVVLFACIGVIVTYNIEAAELRQEETVVLSNGQEVILGDTISKLDAKLAGKVAITRDKKIYQYPKPSQDRPVEVLIYTDQSKVVAIQIIEDEKNRIKDEDKTIGVVKGDLLERFGRGRRISQSRLSEIGESGYTLRLRRAVRHYITNPCSVDKEVDTIVLAYTGTDDLFGAGDVVGCDVELD